MKDKTTRFRMADIPPSRRALFVGVIAWSLAWKGASMWRAARNGSVPWFVALLLSNTMGALDAVYLFAVDKRRLGLRRDEEAILSVTGEPAQGGHGDEPRGPLGP